MRNSKSLSAVFALVAAVVVGGSILFPTVARAGYISLTQTADSITIFGGDYEYYLQANGQSIDGASATFSLGTTVTFSGKLIDLGISTAHTEQIYVLPFANATYAISDLVYQNSTSNGAAYTVQGVYRSAEEIAVPAGATTIVAGQTTAFDSNFTSNTLSTTAVPETGSTLALLGVAFAGVAGLKRRCVG